MITSQIKIILAIRALDIGGAEKQFIELIKHIDKNKFEVIVCSMYGGVQEDIVKNIVGIKYVNLQKTGRYDFYQFYNNYSKLLKELQPDVIYSFLGEMNLFSLWAKPKHTKIIWGFRSSGKDWSKYGKVPQVVFWLQKKLSVKVDKIISNSHASIAYHETNGFNMDKALVIHNGIDSNKFQRNSTKREIFRKKYNLNECDIAIGMVARIDAIKGYDIFAQVAKKILDKYDNIYFFSVGGGNQSIQEECETVLGNYNEKRFFWLGNQKNLEELYSSFDIAVSSSFAEGFSNSIAEAMSCSLATVVTDVGDSSLIVDKFGIVVKVKSIESLYTGLVEMMNRDYVTLGNKSRAYIVEKFSIEHMVSKTEQEIIKCVE